jgi:Zn-dependent protease
MSQDLLQQISSIALLAIPVIVAITFHEAAHGYVARHYGDPTAAEQGRITLNPLKHVDPIGTIILPALLLLSHAGFLFGYAKPVPVNFGRLNHPKTDMIWVAAAGPGMNIALAAISAILLFAVLHLAPTTWLVTLLWGSVQINLMLAVFNLWPIPPLDGSKVAIGLLPPSLALPLWRLQPYGLFVLLALFFIANFTGLDIFGWMIGRPVAFLERPILSLLGVPAPD